MKRKLTQTEKFLRAIKEEGCEDSAEEFEAKLTYGERKLKEFKK
jgi:hypothetical protein